jgi:hypothetical protein
MARKNIKMFFHPLQSEQGSVIIVALLVLFTLTLLGISATTTSTVELQIAANDQLHTIAFYNTECGIFATPKLISNAIDILSEPPVDTDDGSIAPGIEYLPNDGSYVADTFFRQVIGYDAYDGGTSDITFDSGGIPVEVDVERLGQQNIVGGGAEFASGSQGIGAGSTGGVAIFFGMDAAGTGPRNSAANIRAEYRKVVGVPGGL